MSEQVTLNLPDSLLKQVREVATQTQRGLDEVLLEWLDRSAERSVQSQATRSEAELLRLVNLGFSADWWSTYKALIQSRQAEEISGSDLARLVQMSEALEVANVSRIEALSQLAVLRGCSIEEVMDSLGISSPING